MHCFGGQGGCLGDEHQVDTGFHGSQHAVDRAVELFDGVHLHAVGNDDAAKAQLFPQEARHDAAGHGGGDVLRLDLWKEDVGGHHGGCTGLDARNKRFQFPLHQLVKAAVDAGQAKVGIHRRIAMAGEMLERAVDAAVQQAAHHLAAVFGHTLRRIAVAAHADDRVVRVAVDVHDRGQIEIHAAAAQFLGGQQAHIVGVAGVAGGGYRHGTGDVDLTLRQAGYNAALLVDGDEGRHAGFFLHHFAQGGAELFQLGAILDIAAEKDDVADLIFFDKPQKFFRRL